MKSSIKWLISIPVAGISLILLIGSLAPQATKQAHNRYRLCVKLVNSGELAGSVNDCQAKLSRSLPLR